MLLKRTNLFILISSVALLAVLAIQVNWIFQTAKAKEILFNEKANMVISRTAEVLGEDEQACRRLDTCIDTKEIEKIDSMFLYYMEFYDFYIDYSFQVAKVPQFENNIVVTDNTYNQRLTEKVSESGLELVLVLPEKKQFIIAEMGLLFITSVLLILIVLLLFWKTVRSLIKEKKISEHTTSFLNNMTHEFKTPLTNIALAGKMIRKDNAIQEVSKIMHYSGIILDENAKLKQQVEQVLNMTAFERNEIPLQKENIDFHTALNEAIKCTSLQIEHEKGNLHPQLEAKFPIINGDKMHLVNAIINLIDNAIKYAKEKPEITVMTSNVNQNLILKIADKGIGIQKEYQKKIFDNYFRVPTGNIHDVKGFGLGLPYAKKVIELHQGMLTVESNKEEGTTFTITLLNAN